MGLFLMEVRYAIRSLAKDKRIALTAIATLALGIAASTTVFSVFYNLLFNSFHTRDARRLVIPFLYSPQSTVQTNQDSWPLECSVADYLDFRAQNHVFEDVVGFESHQMLLSKNNAGGGGNRKRIELCRDVANAGNGNTDGTRRAKAGFAGVGD